MNDNDITVEKKTIMHELTHWGITPEQHNFVLSYLTDFNVPFACKRTGIRKDKAYRWLKTANVRNMIREKGKEIEQKCDISLEECYNELKRIAFFDHSSYIKKISLGKRKKKTKNGEKEVEDSFMGIELHNIDRIDTRALQGLNIRELSNGKIYVEVKPYNKIDALKELITNLKGYQGPNSLHLHFDKEEEKNLKAEEVTANYEILASED